MITIAGISCSSTPAVTHDQLTPCTSDSDCASGAICASDGTCWTPPGSTLAPPEPVSGLRAVVGPTQTQVDWIPGADSKATLIVRSGDHNDEEEAAAGVGHLSELLVEPGETRTYVLYSVDGAFISAGVAVSMASPPAPVATAGCLTAAAKCVQLSIPDFLATGADLCSAQGLTIFRTVNGTTTPIQLDAMCEDPAPPVLTDVTYSYRLTVGNVEYDSTASSALNLLPGLPIVTASATTDNEGEVWISYTVAPDSDVSGVNLITLDQGSGPLPTPIVVDTYGDDPATGYCGLGLTCQYAISVTDRYGQTAQSAPVSGHGAPGAPTNVVVISGPAGLLVSWEPGVGGATSYGVELDDNSGQYPSPINGVTTNTTSATVPSTPFAPVEVFVYQYWDAARSDRTPGVDAEALPTPDESNLNSQGAIVLGSTPEPISQTFVVGHSGILQQIYVELEGTFAPDAGFEAAATMSRGPDLDRTTDYVLSGSFGTFADAGSSGVFLSIPFGFPVNAGDELQLNFELPAGYSFVATQSAADAGSALIDGVPQPGISLAFATFVMPSSNPTNLVLTDWNGLGAELLTWVGDPTAHAYDIYRTPDGGTESLLAETSQTSYFDTSVLPGTAYSYRLEVIGGTPTVDYASGETEDAFLDTAVLDAHDLVAATSPADGGPAIGQSLTVQTGGQLVRIELGALENAADTSLILYDAEGEPLASATETDNPSHTGPLNAWFEGSAVYSFTGAPVMLTPGEQLSFQIYSMSGTLLTRDTGGNQYPAGEELIDGAPVPDRDLAFKLVLK